MVPHMSTTVRNGYQNHQSHGSHHPHYGLAAYSPPTSILPHATPSGSVNAIPSGSYSQTQTGLYNYNQLFDTSGKDTYDAQASFRDKRPMQEMYSLPPNPYGMPADSVSPLHRFRVCQADIIRIHRLHCARYLRQRWIRTMVHRHPQNGGTDDLPGVRNKMKDQMCPRRKR